MKQMTINDLKQELNAPPRRDSVVMAEITVNGNCYTGPVTSVSFAPPPPPPPPATYKAGDLVNVAMKSGTTTPCRLVQVGWLQYTLITTTDWNRLNGPAVKTKSHIITHEEVMEMAGSLALKVEKL